MVDSEYVPDRGDIVWLEFNPQAGHEQAGRRPALVLSAQKFNMRSGFALFCPITSRIRGYPFEIKLPPDDTITGAVLSDQIRSLDWRARYAKFGGRVSAQTLSDVQEKISIIMFPNSSELTKIIKIEELLRSINKFVSIFELVFDKKWENHYDLNSAYQSLLRNLDRSGLDI